MLIKKQSIKCILLILTALLPRGGLSSKFNRQVNRRENRQGFLHALSQEEILLYFFLVLVAGPEGTSFWSHGRIGKLLKLTADQVLEALRGLLARDLVAFRYPTFQVLSLPKPAPRGGEENR